MGFPTLSNRNQHQTDSNSVLHLQILKNIILISSSCEKKSAATRCINHILPVFIYLGFRRLFIIFWRGHDSEKKMLISTRCMHGFMSSLIKKSWTDCNHQATRHSYNNQIETQIAVVQLRVCFFKLDSVYDLNSQTFISSNWNCFDNF